MSKEKGKIIIVGNDCYNTPEKLRWVSASGKTGIPDAQSLAVIHGVSVCEYDDDGKRVKLDANGGTDIVTASRLALAHYGRVCGIARRCLCDVQITGAYNRMSESAHDLSVANSCLTWARKRLAESRKRLAAIIDSESYADVDEVIKSGTLRGVKISDEIDSARRETLSAADEVAKREKKQATAKEDAKTTKAEFVSAVHVFILEYFKDKKSRESLNGVETN